MTILDNKNELKNVFQTTTLWMIFITVFLCGGTIKPLVNFLHIKKQEEKIEEKMFDDVNEKCIDHVMSGIVVPQVLESSTTPLVPEPSYISTQSK